jgi:putative flavoprotein involved in K+ transport
MSRLPGSRYLGPDPDGFMTKAETIDLLDGYARRIGAPVWTRTTVEKVRIDAGGVEGGRVGGFEVVTDQGVWHCRALVVATGASSEPRVPALAADLPASIRQLTALRYRNPDQLGDGDGEVLVVGASASGTQIADELARAGRQVTVAGGEHVGLPRTYRGRDIHWWMDVIGQLDERWDEVEDLARARRHTSLQLIGSPERRTLDLNALTGAGVGLVGKLLRIAGPKAQFSGGLRHLVAGADLKQNRLLDRIDEFVAENELEDAVGEPDRPAATRLGAVPTEVPLSRFDAVIWATGYRPTYPWLDPAAFDQRGRLAHDGGMGAVPGLYVLGLPFLRRRKSSFIDGVGPDATDLAAHLHGFLDLGTRRFQRNGR